MPNGEVVGHKERIDLYRMEYEYCVSSYHNIYEEIWKIFSYLSAISGAVLVFGREYFSAGMTVFVSMLPLIFWFLGVYLPMDRYGNMRSERLAAIEEILNRDFGVTLRHFLTLRGKAQWGLTHKFGFGWRVRTAVKVFGVIVIFICLGGFGYAICTRQLTKTKGPSRFEAEVQVTSPVQIEMRSPTPAIPSDQSKSK